jgi:hypothetical protein
MVPVESRSDALSPLGSRARTDCFVSRLACTRRCVLGFICLVGVATVASIRLHAQQGLPIVQQTTTMGSNGPSPVFVDANQFLSFALGDACLAINHAIGQMQTVKNGVVDARGITGDVQCAVNMFGSGNPTGKLLLGNVVLHVSVTQVQPPLFQVEGVGWENDDTSANTVIRACKTAGTNCTGALGGSTPVLWCWGKSGICGDGSMSDHAVFGSFTQYALFDCNGLPSCVAMQAFDTQEGSGCWHCQFHGWGNGGIGLQICNHSAFCQNSSFQDLYISITPNVNTCTTSAIPIVVNTGGADNGGPKFIKQVTVDPGNCSSGTVRPYDAFRLSAVKTAVENINLQGTTVGIRLGGDNATNSVTIDGISVGQMVPQSGKQCGNSVSTIQAILLDRDPMNPYAITNVSLHSIRGDSAGGNVIQDCSNGRTVTGTNENDAVGEYLTGPAAGSASGGIAFTTSTTLGAFPSGLRQTVNVVPFSITPTFDLSKGNVQQIACTGGGVAVSATVTNFQPGMEMTLIFVQATLGTACTFTFSSHVHGTTTVNPGLGSVSL